MCELEWTKFFKHFFVSFFCFIYYFFILLNYSSLLTIKKNLKYFAFIKIFTSL